MLKQKNSQEINGKWCLWYELKFARLTSSRIYEACRCKTTSGSLLESIMGASGTLTTEPIIRGQNLESLVLKQVEYIKKN